MEIAPGIHRIETPLGDRFVCLYLLVGSEHALLLDTGVDSTPTEYLAPYLDEIGLAADKIRYVVNSHADFDHTAGNQSAKELIAKRQSELKGLMQDSQAQVAALFELGMAITKLQQEEQP